ncbi:hypothetical protein GCM10025762_33740 [Haloechinothrix salitolerans]
MLTGLLVLGSLGSLIASFVLDQIIATYTTLVLSLVGVCVLVWTRFWKGWYSGSAKGSKIANKDDGQSDTAAVADVGGETDRGRRGPSRAREQPSFVRVVSGRRRYHVADCSLLEGLPDNVISLDEAQEEGFTACTACLPNDDPATTTSPTG